MPTSTNDDPTAAGATNVFLTQRSATAPYRREEVSIQGDDNPWKALGFDAAGMLGAHSVDEMIAADPAAARTALEVSEDPFVSVDTEAQFDAALAAGRSIILRGEGTGGVVSLTTPKSILADHTTIKGPAVCRFTLDQNASATPRAITVHADDVTLSDFELTSTQPLASNTCYGIAFAEGAENHGHRLHITDLVVYNWQRCLSKDGSLTTTSQEDVVIERLLAHTAKEYVVYLNFGLTRLIMRDCRLLGWLPGATQVTTQNAMYGGSNWNDCSFDNCHFGNVGRMGFEATPASYQYTHIRTRLHWCRSENCGSMGFSIGFVEGGIFEKCKAQNVKQCGFEVAGRGPNYPGDPPGETHYAQAVIESCEIDGVTHTGPCYGISLDGARDTSIRAATRISNITTSLTDGACGIGLTASERCSVKLADLTDCGHLFLYTTRGHLPNTTGHHVFENNTFRNPGGSGNMHRAIYVDDQSACIRNNVVFQKVGTYLGYQALTTNAAAAVTVDAVALAVGSVNFGGVPGATNLILDG